MTNVARRFSPFPVQPGCFGDLKVVRASTQLETAYVWDVACPCHLPHPFTPISHLVIWISSVWCTLGTYDWGSRPFIFFLFGAFFLFFPFFPSIPCVLTHPRINFGNLCGFMGLVLRSCSRDLHVLHLTFVSIVLRGYGDDHHLLDSLSAGCTLSGPLFCRRKKGPGHSLLFRRHWGPLYILFLPPTSCLPSAVISIYTIISFLYLSSPSFLVFDIISSFCFSPSYIIISITNGENNGLVNAQF